MITGDKLAKLFTSSIFDRQHGYVYLKKSTPCWMCCASFDIEEMYNRGHNVMDTVRMVNTNNINLWEMWASLLPIDKLSAVSFKYTGIQSCNQRFGKDNVQAIDAGLLTLPNGIRYYTREENRGKRTVITEVPVMWPINDLNVQDLFDKVGEVKSWVDQAPKQLVVELSSAKINRSGLGFIALKDTIFNVAVNIPYKNSFDGINLFGYGKQVGLDKVCVKIGQYGHVIRYYVYSTDEYATTECALPVGWKFGEYRVEQGNINE